MDLGLNTDAVCTIMRSDGTVLEESLLIFPVKRPDVPCVETDKQVSARAWLRTGEKAGRRTNTNTELGRKIAGAVTGYAEENHADVIVFEYLETKGKISGRRNRNCICGEKGYTTTSGTQRDADIRHMNTSRLACDGSGTVVIQAITVYVHSRMEKDITVIFRRPIIEPDILYGNS